MKLLGLLFINVILFSISSFGFADEKLISQNLSKSIPGLTIKSIESSQVKGLYQVETTSGEVLFSSEDGRFFIAGDLYTTENDKLVNLSELKRGQGRASKVNAIPNDQKIIFPAIGEVKGRISIFTDIDCGYCRKLHKEVPELNSMGVEVSYLAYPRAGIESESYKKYVSAWCASDKLTAFTKAKNGQAIDAKVCANPITDQYNLGREMGISGTPAIILQDGNLIPGYVNAQKLGKALGIL